MNEKTDIILKEMINENNILKSNENTYLEQIEKLDKQLNAKDANIAEIKIE
jgi:hypothetical protein